jgi:hypothetical protein
VLWSDRKRRQKGMKKWLTFALSLSLSTVACYCSDSTEIKIKRFEKIKLSQIYTRSMMATSRSILFLSLSKKKHRKFAVLCVSADLHPKNFLSLPRRHDFFLQTFAFFRPQNLKARHYTRSNSRTLHFIATFK